MLVSELKSLAKSLNVTGYSRMVKADLILAIGDAYYAEAEAEDAARTPVTYSSVPADDWSAEDDAAMWQARKVTESAPESRKSYTERMLNRVQGYYAQNGCQQLTAKQNRRIEKKYMRQYSRLMSQLSV